MTQLPTYASRYGHGEQAYMQPCNTTGGTQYIFVVETDPALMTASANGFLGTPTDGKVTFEGLGRYGLVHFIRAPKLTSEGQEVGYVVDRETAVSMPLVMRTEGAILPAYQLTTWMPYVLINSQGGCTAGREIFGFLKALGDIDIPALDEPLLEWSAKTQVFREMNPDCEAEWAPLWVVRSKGGPAQVESTWQSLDDLAVFLIDALKGWSDDWSILERVELFTSVLQLVAQRTFPTTNLKQFRDAAQSDRASMQELVTAPMVVTQLRNGGVLKGDFELELPQYASHDVAGDLGVVGGDGTRYPVRLAMYLDFDFIVPSGTVNWRWK